MEFDAEFYVTLGFLVFLCLLGYLGAHRMLLSSLDNRGKAIADELAQATKLRDEATALLASFEKKAAEAEANAAAIIADARARGRDAGQGDRRTNGRFHRSPHQASGGQNRDGRSPGRRRRARRRRRSPGREERAEVVLRDQTQGAAGADLVTREISSLGGRLN